MPRTEWGWMVTADEIDSWVLPNPPGCDDVLAINKPAHVVCHPTKHGHWSSLSSAIRERFHLDPVHLISRLDRETSGVVLIGKTLEAARRLRVQGKRQGAESLRQNRVQKTYLALLVGQLREPITVDQPLARLETGVFRNQQQVAEENGQRAITIFEPVSSDRDFTLVRAYPITGRMHQIRIHAAHIGHPVAGDKLYPNEAHQLTFLRDGWTPELAAALRFERQALHAWSMTIDSATWAAPLPRDFCSFLLDAGFSISC